MLIIIAIICFCVGIIIGIALLRKPIKIGFEVSSVIKILNGFLIFFLVSIVIVVDLAVSYCNLLYYQPKRCFGILLSRAIEGGLLMVVGVVLSSFVISMIVKLDNLDLCIGYSQNFIKGYYTAVVTANCIWLFFLVGEYIISEEPVMKLLISRIIGWILTVIGTWMGIGFGCEGRITKEYLKEKNKKIKVNRKEVWSSRKLYLIGFTVNCILIWIYTYFGIFKKYRFQVTYLFLILILGVMGAVCSVGVSTLKDYYVFNKSEYNVVKLIEKVKVLGRVEGKYRTVKYSLVNENKQKYLLVHKGNVISKYNKEDIKIAFEEKKIIMEEFDSDKCKSALEKIGQKRKECLRKEYQYEKDNRIKELKKNY